MYKEIIKIVKISNIYIPHTLIVRKYDRDEGVHSYKDMENLRKTFHLVSYSG